MSTQNPTLEESVTICRELEPFLSSVGYHTALTGGTLYKGVSTKDVDIVVYPHKISEQRSVADLVVLLNSIGVGYSRDAAPSCQDKDVGVFSYKGYRVDLLFLK